ncbi:MAG: HPP family protein [Lachnospiraceae bacterium]|nr:HPP family protein [Lachnospiraceae bacterium]
MAFFISECDSNGLHFISKTTFAPMISAIVLPVMLGTKSPVYIIAAFLLTLSVIVIRLSTDKMGVTTKRDYIYVEHDIKDELKVYIFRCIVMFALCITGFVLKLNFMVAPPLLVLFTELSSPLNKGKKNIFKITGCVFLCAVSGVISRVVVCEMLKMPLFFAAFFTGLFILIVLFTFKVFLPPAGAIAVLALLIDEKFLYLYPFQILIGTLIYVFAAETYGRLSAKKSIEK